MPRGDTLPETVLKFCGKDGGSMSTEKTRVPNAEQQAVIGDLQENIILFASAGTGKTFTVARRVSRILQEGRAAPGEILCLTFTNKAAAEMREDIFSYAGQGAADITVSTIHSFCYQVLREEYKAGDEAVAEPMICDDVDEGEEIKDILLSMGMEAPGEQRRISVLHAPAFLAGFVSSLKHQRELADLYSDDPEKDYQQAYSRLCGSTDRKALLSFYDKTVRVKGVDSAFEATMERKAGALAAAYDDILRLSNRVDFDDLICEVHRHWKKNEWLERWRHRYKYIFVDEMQDTSDLEYDTLKRIFGGANIMMCGDFFQTIYEWRHSDPVKVLGAFDEEFRPRRFMFSENYRSTRTLVSASFGYLKNTFPDLLGRFCPETVHVNSREEGEKILFVRAPSYDGEAAWIYNYIRESLPEDPTRLCVMARSNGYIANLYNRLDTIAKSRPEGERLRFFTADRDYRFYKRPMIKDILAFFGVLLNDSDAVSMARITEKYCRGIGPAAIARIREQQTLGASLTSFLSDSYRREGDPYAALTRGLEEGNVVIYDTETTGLNLETDQIIQISAIRVDKNGNITGTLDQLVIPTVAISEAALTTHHKSCEDIIRGGGIEARAALERFSAFVEGAVLVGHNSLRFDAPLVSRQLAECGLPPLHIIAEYDTMMIAQQFLPESVNYKLDTLCGRFHVTNLAAHDALGDITATGAVLNCLVKQYVIPAAEKRIAFLAQYHDKLEKFCLFIDSLRDKLRQGDLRGMTESIIGTLNLQKRYPGRSTDDVLSDFVLSLPEGTVDNAYLYLRSYVNDAALSGSQMDTLIRKLNKIPIITVHQSKGCEFDTVIIAGADANNFPSYMAVQDGTEEEEKRVFYVAISRAGKKLVLTYSAFNDAGKRLSFTPYLRNIPAECGTSLSLRE